MDPRSVPSGGNFFRSLFRKMNAIRTDRISAMGKLYQIPLIPKYIGIKKTRGIRKNPCFDKVIRSAGIAFPIAWK